MNWKDYAAGEKVVAYLNDLKSFRRVMNRILEVKRLVRTAKLEKPRASKIRNKGNIQRILRVSKILHRT
jgi:hypothetical protein